VGDVAVGSDVVVASSEGEDEVMAAVCRRR
jgi:hypothetical protein